MPDLISVSFTSARNLDERGHGTVINVLTVGVPRADRYITGGARNGDAFIGRWLVEHYPEAEHIVVVPADKSQVDPWWLAVDGNVRVLTMPPGTTFKDRNEEVVRLGLMLFGFPAYPEDDRRSLGSETWQTIGLAKAAGKLSQWHCVKPPFRGCIEKWPHEFTQRQVDEERTHG